MAKISLSIIVSLIYSIVPWTANPVVIKTHRLIKNILNPFIVYFSQVSQVYCPDLLYLLLFLEPYKSQASQRGPIYPSAQLKLK